MKNFLLLLLLCSGIASPAISQEISEQRIADLISEYRTLDRGPYRDIRWFCKDGTTNDPKEPCEEPGNQRARYRDEVIDLAARNHIFLGQILATTQEADFWDEDRDHSRTKQYLIEQYLKGVDNGWINERAQFYRGATQIEDEREWGKEFLENRLSYNSNIEKKYFLLRQTAQFLPHSEEGDLSFNIRAVSKNLADDFPRFQDLRIKIHGQPGKEDIQAVEKFQETYSSKLNKDQKAMLGVLLMDMKIYYRPANLNELTPLIKKISSKANIREELETYVADYASRSGDPNRMVATANILWNIRLAISDVGKRYRLPLLDISNTLEDIYFREVAEWEPKTTHDLKTQICYTAKVAAAAGFLEKWEWEHAEAQMSGYTGSHITIQEVYLQTARRLLEWGTGMVNGVFGDVLHEWAKFEPKTHDFVDDRIRASILLRLGQQVGRYGTIFAERAGYANKMFNFNNQESSRGLNPGYARGELVVIEGDEENLQVDINKIYVFRRPSSDLKPVAGIATVTEGNMVSHVQLLARNLGIPNAVISPEHFNNLKKYNGKTIFYAVSSKGTILMKSESEMTEIENRLFSNEERTSNKVTVPTEKIDLTQKKVLDMRTVDANSSGKICGPKAANLGELKKQFPKLVVEGLVIPFGIFREHLNQDMPGENKSYWAYLNDSFEEAKKMESNGNSRNEIQVFTLSRLKTLQNAILTIQLSDEFVDDLEAKFKKVFNDKMGRVPVFLRSDTNMEDLKEFTGAGLNLTKFNVVDRNKIISGIREVWASPYTERSFKWRQSYLLNPENVFPSILIIPTVDVEYSGVMITKGITTQDGRDITVAFSRGAGGAVDGQAAETYLLDHRYYNKLLSPAREPDYRRLPDTGGSVMNKTSFNDPILKPKNLKILRQLAYDIHNNFPKTDEGAHGPWDIELGFKDDKAWLFQVRPFVENKQALGSSYLESL